MKAKNYAAMATRLFTAIVMVIVVGMAMVACTDQKDNLESFSTKKETPTPDPSRESSVDTTFICEVNENRLDHSMTLNVNIWVKGSDTYETTLKSGEIKSYGVLSLDKEIIRVDEDSEKPYQITCEIIVTL